MNRTPVRQDQDQFTVNCGKILYKIVRVAFEGRLSSDATQPAVIWWDTLSEFRDDRYFKSLLPHQIVNRIPNSSTMCMKVSLARAVRRMQETFGVLYAITPVTYILPDEVRAVEAARRAAPDVKFILKPSAGALGAGIEILRIGAPIPPAYCAPNSSAVAQVYVEPLLLENRKFDLRVYALVASLDPLRVFISRDGIARFCAERYGADSLQATLTNTAVNKSAPGVVMSDITRPLDAVLPLIARVNAVLQKIGRVVVRTVIAALPEMGKGYAERFGAARGRCFQIFGFDVLFTRDGEPLVLEVNYRPSLSYGTDAERELKVRMLREATRIAWGIATGRRVALGRFVQVCPDPSRRTDYSPEIAQSVALEGKPAPQSDPSATRPPR
jgi:hypothetical protein